MNRRCLFCRGGVLGVVLLWALSSGSLADDEPSSLRALYDDAARLAETPEGLKQAIAKYRAVIERHRANERLYQSALRRLAKCYTEAGDVEEAMRFYLGLVYGPQAEDRPEALREIFQEFRLKHPELFEKVVADMGLSGSRPRSTAASAAPSEDLANAILQRKDKELRVKAVEKLQQMLAPQSPDQQKKTALSTLLKALSANFDRDAFRPLVAPLLKSEDATVRMLAVRCLPGVGGAAEDLALVVPLAEDPSPHVRTNVGGTLIHLGKGEQTEVVVPALMKLLQDDDPEVIEQNIRSMWGQYSSPEFDELLIELSRQPRYHHNTIYFCLSTMRHKSVPVCRRLVEELDDPDWNNSGRAAWGLAYGVADEAQSIVEEGLLGALREETHAYTRRQEFRALRNVATEKSRSYLETVAASELETDEARQLAREILAHLDRTP